MNFRDAGDSGPYVGYHRYGSQTYYVGGNSKSSEDDIRVYGQVSGQTDQLFYGTESALGVSGTNPIKGIVKFHAPDSRIMVVYSNSTFEMYETMATPSVTLSNPQTNSIDASYTANPNVGGTPTISLATDSGMTNLVGSFDATKGINSHTQTFSGLLPSTRYFSQVVLNDGYVTKTSSVKNTYTLAAVPSNLASNDISSKSIGLIWSNNSNGPTTIYEIERSLTGNPSGTDWVNIYTGSATSCADTDLDPKTIYYYRVRAKNANSIYTAYSNIISVQTADKDGVPPTISLSINNGDAVLMDTALSVKAVVGDNRTANSALTYSYSINGNAWSAPASVGTSTGIVNLSVEHGLVTSGDLNFQMRVVDDDGNVGIANAKVYYQAPAELPGQPSGENLTAPGATVLSIGTLDEESVYFTTNATLYIDMSTQSQPGYQISVDTGPYSPTFNKNKKATVSLGVEGLHVMSVRLVNAAGIAGTEKEYRIVVDNTSPSLAISTTNRASITSEATQELFLDYADNIMENLTYSWRRNSGEWQEYQPLSDTGHASVSIPLVGGANTISVRVKDGAGNLSEIKQYVIFKI